MQNESQYCPQSNYNHTQVCINISYELNMIFSSHNITLANCIFSYVPIECIANRRFAIMHIIHEFSRSITLKCYRVKFSYFELIFIQMQENTSLIFCCTFSFALQIMSDTLWEALSSMSFCMRYKFIFEEKFSISEFVEKKHFSLSLFHCCLSIIKRYRLLRRSFKIKINMERWIEAERIFYL